MAQVPPPPQADGRKIFSFARVDNRLDPPFTFNSRSSLMVILTGPEGASFALANNSINTSNSITPRNIPVAISIM